MKRVACLTSGRLLSELRDNVSRFIKHCPNCGGERPADEIMCGGLKADEQCAAGSSLMLSQVPQAPEQHLHPLFRSYDRPALPEWARMPAGDLSCSRCEEILATGTNGATKGTRANDSGARLIETRKSE